MSDVGNGIYISKCKLYSIQKYMFIKCRICATLSGPSRSRIYANHLPSLYYKLLIQLAYGEESLQSLIY